MNEQDRIKTINQEMINILAWFLEDPNVDLMLGGNPSYINNGLASARDVLRRAKKINDT